MANTQSSTDLASAVKSLTVTNGEKSTVIIEGELPFALLAVHKNAALKTLGKDVEIDGFRKGHVPEKMLIEHVGPMALLTEMAERALADAYPVILETHSIDAVGRPDVAITKLADNNPLGFKATIATMPDVALPDYKKIAATQNKIKGDASVSDADVAEGIEKIQRQKLAYDRMQEKAKKKADAEKEGLSLPTPETADDDTDYSKEPVPELTDEYVATLGNFKDVADFKTQIRAHLEKEKQEEVTAKHRAALTDAILEETKADLPDVLIDAELNQMFAQMEQDLARANLTLDGYLEHIKKTKEDLKKEWAPAAEKRAKLQLVLNKIGAEEKIEPDQERVKHDVAHLLEHYKDADPNRVRVYVESMLRNEAVMGMLESQ